jgi:hypothetical protein
MKRVLLSSSDGFCQYVREIGLCEGGDEVVPHPAASLCREDVANRHVICVDMPLHLVPFANAVTVVEFWTTDRHPDYGLKALRSFVSSIRTFGVEYPKGAGIFPAVDNRRFVTLYELQTHDLITKMTRDYLLQTGVSVLGQVVDMSDEQLNAIRGVGRSRIRSLRDAQSRYGL